MGILLYLHLWYSFFKKKEDYYELENDYSIDNDYLELVLTDKEQYVKIYKNHHTTNNYIIQSQYMNFNFWANNNTMRPEPTILPINNRQTILIRKELLKTDELKYWYFAYAESSSINEIYNSFRSDHNLDSSNYTNRVFIIDKVLNQRGRIDDRDDDQKEKNLKLFGLYSYNSILVSQIKGKMNDDIRILFTEYRQKRKGNFNSNIRRISNLDGNDE